jgi:hypothetical protein
MAKKSHRASRKRATAASSDAAAPPSTSIPQEWLNATFRKVIFRTFGHQRFTQDSAILPDVWLAYAKADPDAGIDLILTPRAGHRPGAIAALLDARLKLYREAHQSPSAAAENAMIAYSRSSVVAKLTFNELMRVVVPMTAWWNSLPQGYRSFAHVGRNLAALKGERRAFKKIVNTTGMWEYYRFIVLAGFIQVWRRLPDPETVAEILQSDGNHFGDIRPIAEAFLELLHDFKPMPTERDEAQIWSISINRTSQVSLYLSGPATKADAAQKLFQIDASGLSWAVIDCGIDAAHPAFLKREKPLDGRKDEGKVRRKGTPKDIPLAKSRVVRTYDFTFLRQLLAFQRHEYKSAGGRSIKLTASQRGEMEDLRRRIGLGREIDWDLILPLLEVPHDKRYEKPAHEHGTHVAGIIAGHWPADENNEGENLFGMCPDLRLYDFRVFDNLGNTDEFIVMAALQAVAHFNRSRDNPVIHGVNLSLSIRHEVMSYACGRTPICDECSRLVGGGVAVVAASGNQGFNESPETGGGQFGSYRIASITDPGNAEAVITVGSTHRSEPHTYGVSYFSSRGPTGDGRRKPDLVAPGEKITAPIPNCGSKRMDGTSMAAPHVSGAAALLMARHRELVGQPEAIKRILCASATDLGREKDFQGAGMLDILRALQSV